MMINTKVLKEGNKFKKTLALEYFEEVYFNDAHCRKGGKYFVTFSDKKSKNGVLTEAMFAALETIFKEIELQEERRKTNTSGIASLGN